MIDNKITFREATSLYENSYAGISTSNRFSLFESNDNYNTNFPSLPNNGQSHRQPPTRGPRKTNEPLSQPVASTSRHNEDNLKKRKYNSSPSPKPMFPFVFAPTTPLPPNNNAHNIGIIENEKIETVQNYLIETFAGYFVKLLENFKSLDEIKSLQVETLKKGLFDIVKSPSEGQK